MINVSLTSLILIVSGLGMVLVLMWWVFGVAGVRREETKKFKGVVMCRICGVHYESDEDDVTKCPACGTLNERKPVGVI